MIDVPTATADAKTETGLAARLVETAKAFPVPVGVSIGASVRVSAAGTWTVEHWEADPAPWDGRTVA